MLGVQRGVPTLKQSLDLQDLHDGGGPVLRCLPGSWGAQGGGRQEPPRQPRISLLSPRRLPVPLAGPWGLFKAAGVRIDKAGDVGVPGP